MASEQPWTLKVTAHLVRFETETRLTGELSPVHTPPAEIRNSLQTELQTNAIALARTHGLYAV